MSHASEQASAQACDQATGWVQDGMPISNRGESAPPDWPRAATAAGEAGEIARLSIMLEVSDAVAGAGLKLHPALQDALLILARRLNGLRAAVTLIRHDGSLTTVESPELDRHVRAGRPPAVEAVRRVLDTGRAITVKRMNSDLSLGEHQEQRPGFAPADRGVICVPIPVHDTVIGALSLEVPFTQGSDHDGTPGVLRGAAALFGRAIVTHRLIEGERRRLETENGALRHALRAHADLSCFVDASGPMRRVSDQAVHAAATETPVLLRGEPGTGKELVAHAIHANSQRAQHPFEKASCAGLPASVIESELFGTETRGAAGVGSVTRGRIELADGGSVLLEEIADLAPGTQLKLLRVLQRHELERIGGADPVHVNVRIFAATSKDLDRAVSEGTFRADLFQHLNAAPIFLPPLRERRADLALLIDLIVARLSGERRKPIKHISTAAVDALMLYQWPGNVHELEHVLDRAIVKCEGDAIQARHLPLTIQTAGKSDTIEGLGLVDAVDGFERDLIQDALTTARGNAAEAARLLRTTQRVMNYKIKKLKIEPRRFKVSTPPDLLRRPTRTDQE